MVEAVKMVDNPLVWSPCVRSYEWRNILVGIDNKNRRRGASSYVGFYERVLHAYVLGSC